MSEDDFDVDFDEDDEILDEKGVEQKPSLKELWETNAAFKFIAIAVVLVVAAGSYFIFMPDSTEESKSMLRISDTSQVKHIPGQEDLDPAYKKALEESNKQKAQEAALSGGSSLPTPIGKSKVVGLEMPQVNEGSKTDPLAEWRKATKMRRMKVKETVADNEDEEAFGGSKSLADTVPMVQPIRPKVQTTIRKDPGAAKNLAEQMRTIIAAQAPPDMQDLKVTDKESEYTAYMKLLESESNKGGESSKQIKTSRGLRQKYDAAEDKVIVSAGTIAYAQTVTELNSDILGPVMAQVLSGPFAGARAIGEVKVVDEYMTLSFNSLVKDDVVYRVEGIGMDEHTTLTGQATDVDHHYMKRIVLPAAAKFIEGYTSAIAKTATTTTTGSGGATATDTKKPSPKESIFKGMQESAKVVSDLLSSEADKPITVKIARGTTFGILFTRTVTTGDVE